MRTRIGPNAVALLLSAVLWTSARAAVPLDGLVAYYSFDGNANDVSGNGNNGTVLGATLTPDRFGNPDSAYYFGGDGDCIFMASSASLNLTADLTIAAWVNLSASSVDTNAIILSDMLEVSPHSGYSFRLWGNKLRFFCGDQSLFSSSPLQIDTWTHVAVVLSDTTATVYISGAQDSSGGVAAPASSSVAPTIGASSQQAYCWQGKLDDIAVYRRALSPAEIIELAQAIPEPTFPALLWAGVMCKVVRRILSRR